MEEGRLFQNKYRIGKKLGEGGMGMVYAAVQEPSGLPVAIKLVSAKEVSARNLQGGRLLRESRVLAMLNHNNLVRLHDADQTAEGDYYLVMELVEGDTLRTLISRARKRGTVLDLQEVLHVMLQVTEGVGAAHKAGIVHRDLKPDNIIVSEGWIVRVVDFGLAKNPAVSPPPSGHVQTNPANVIGTPRYMAPEQVRGYEVDARCDIYAIGVTLYEALTGHLPYEREGDEPGVTEIMGRHCYAEPMPIAEYVPSCSERVQAIVLRCLAKDLADRYQNARDLAREIRAALVEETKALAEEARAQRREAKEVRETAPMPPQWSPGVVLPFAGSAPHRVRETAPMPPPSPSGPPQPTYAASVAPAQRGVGYTTKMARPSAAAIDEAELATKQAGALALEAETDRGSRPSAGSISGVQLKKASRMATAAPEVSMEQSPVQGKKGPPLVFAPIVGTVVAFLALVVMMELRSREPRSEPPMPSSSATAPASVTTTAEMPAPSASASAVPTSSASTVAIAPTAAVATAPPAPTMTAKIVVKPASRPTATSAAPSPTPAPAAEDPPRRPGKRPITPPPRPGEQDAQHPKSTRLFGAEP
jgi:serine/threonine-protein kinase